jgi:hypothetical protein
MHMHTQQTQDSLFEHVAWYARVLQALNKTPALLALIVQATSLGLIWLYANMGNQIPNAMFDVDLTFYIFSLVLLQSMVATCIATCVGMAVWWRWIHFFFPIALWLMSIAEVPSSVYLIGFIVTLAIYWTTFKTRVPFYPSRPSVWHALHAFMQQRSPDKSLRVIDIGSGLGDLSMYIAQKRPIDVVEGIEIAPLPWLISKVRSHIKGSNAKFTIGNYEKLNFANYDIVFAYLSPAAMPNLWKKASQEMRKGSVLISLEFDIPEALPPQIIHTGKSTPKLFVWRMA